MFNHKNEFSRVGCLDSQKVAGEIFLLMIGILSFPFLNTQIQAIATAETATVLEQLIGLVLPYGLIFIYLILSGVIVYEVFKN